MLTVSSPHACTKGLNQASASPSCIVKQLRFDLGKRHSPDAAVVRRRVVSWVDDLEDGMLEKRRVLWAEGFKTTLDRPQVQSGKSHSGGTKDKPRKPGKPLAERVWERARRHCENRT